MSFSLNLRIFLIFCIVQILYGCSASVIENKNSMEKIPQNIDTKKQVVGYFYIGGFTGNSYAVKNKRFKP